METDLSFYVWGALEEAICSVHIAHENWRGDLKDTGPEGWRCPGHCFQIHHTSVPFSYGDLYF